MNKSSIEEVFDCRMEQGNIFDILKELDAYKVKDWYVNYTGGGSEFEDLACAFCDADEASFLDHVAWYISETIDEQEFCNIIIEENWDVILSPRQLTLVDDYFDDYRFIYCIIEWKDDREKSEAIIMIGSEDSLSEDDIYTDEDITYYAADLEAFADLCDEDNKEDFVITKILSMEE